MKCWLVRCKDSRARCTAAEARQARRFGLAYPYPQYGGIFLQSGSGLCCISGRFAPYFDRQSESNLCFSRISGRKNTPISQILEFLSLFSNDSHSTRGFIIRAEQQNLYALLRGLWYSKWCIKIKTTALHGSPVAQW